MLDFKKNFLYLKNSLNLNLTKIHQKTGIKKTVLENYKFSSSLPSYENIIKIAEFFNVSIDFLLLNSNNNFINYCNLFSLAEKTNELHSMQRNHIEDSITQFIDKKEETISSIFDDENKFKFENSIHKNIQILRDTEKISQTELAKILNLKSRVSISNIERGETKIPYDLLHIISKKYSISIHYLITGIPLQYNIKEIFLKENLVIFDKTASLQDIQTIVHLMEKIVSKHKNKE